MYGYHGASGHMCGEEVLPGPTVAPRTPQQYPSTMSTSLEPAGAQPIIRRAHFTAYITSQLVSCGNREGQVTNSDLENWGKRDPPRMYGQFFWHTQADHDVPHKQHYSPLVG